MSAPRDASEGHPILPTSYQNRFIQDRNFHVGEEDAGYGGVGVVAVVPLRIVEADIYAVGDGGPAVHDFRWVGSGVPVSDDST